MGLVLLDFVVEQLGVGQRMVDHERPAKARAKGHLRLGAKADSGASDLAGVAGNEMVDGLVGREFGDGRHNPGRVASEENDVFGMTGAFFGQMIFDVRERMGRTGVFGDGVIIEVEVAGDGIEGDVFEDGAKTAGAGVDLWLGVVGKTNHLGVSPISWRLGSAERVVLPVPERPKKMATSPEEPTFRGAVHGKHALQREKTIQNGENSLLDFAGVTGAADDGEAFAEIDEDEG